MNPVSKTFIIIKKNLFQFYFNDYTSYLQFEYY